LKPNHLATLDASSASINIVHKNILPNGCRHDNQK
jgi:hypothetical protein